ncbi:hypothetical protein M9Y10_027729 [Tritrichomonas musculus]|uniref:Uncharacterized protein n=1 Tax=Tritrichomonas musculus TaxID=1915356 RepID=A0ABR2H3U1_9EUKA
MWRATELMKKVGPLLNKDLNEAVNESAQSFIDTASEDVINHITYSYIKTSKRYYSTSNLKMNSTAGYTSIKRAVSGNKI